MLNEPLDKACIDQPCLAICLKRRAQDSFIRLPWLIVIDLRPPDNTASINFMLHSRGAHLRLKHPIPKNVANHDHGNFQSECQWPVCKNHDELILMGKNIGLILKSPNADLRFKHGVQLTLQILQHALPHA